MPATISDKQKPSSKAYPHRLRLTSEQDFSKVFKKNTSCRDRYFRIMAQTGNGLGFARLGQVVSRKVDKRAVGRNRIKRLVRETFRLHIATQSSNNGMDFVVMAHRQAALEIDNQALVCSLEQLWQKIEQKLCRQSLQSKQDQ